MEVSPLMPEKSTLMTENIEKNTIKASNKDEIKDLSVKITERHPESFVHSISIMNKVETQYTTNHSRSRLVSID